MLEPVGALAEYEGGEEAEYAAPVDPIADLIEMSQVDNLVENISPERLVRLADYVVQGYEIDRDSRADWLKIMQRGVELAAQEVQPKTYPYEGAANTMSHILAQAAVQFNARALPAVLPEGNLVKCKVHGRDDKGRKAARGARVSAHASHKIRNTPGWEEGTDELCSRLPVEGHLFRKWRYDSGRRRCDARLLSAETIIVNEGCGTLERAPRITEVMELAPHEIVERIRLGQFIEFDWENAPPADNPDKDLDVLGRSDEYATQEFLQQYLRYDLDDDGYPEPYICTVHRATNQVVRVVANWTADTIHAQNGEMISIDAQQFIVDYRFFPSLKGGYHGIGLAHLIGNNIDNINRITNMLMDAGHMSVLGGGFIGKGLNIGQGRVRFRPGEWKYVNTGGADIRAGIVPLPPVQPSATLFQLLGLLIEGAKEMGNVNAMMTGEKTAGNMAPGTVLALIEQGAQVFNAAFARLWRSLGAEFDIVCRIIAQFESPEDYAKFHDMMPEEGAPEAQQAEQISPQADYAMADMDIEPIANPRAVMAMQEIAAAEQLLMLSQQGQVDPREATRRMLEAMHARDIEKLMPQPDPQAQAMQARKAQLLEQLQMRGAQAEVAKAEAEIGEKQASAMAKEASAIKTIADAEALEEGQNIEQYQKALDRQMKQRELALKELSLIQQFQDNDARSKNQ